MQPHDPDLPALTEPITDAGGAIRFIESLIRAEPRSQAVREAVGLEPMRRLLHALGEPQAGLHVAHIAGSKGKGTTALVLDGLLRAEGARTGLFTSPHLERWTERICVDGRECSEAELVSACERLRPVVRALRAARPDLTPSFFDVLTAAALLVFESAGVDHAVLETGLGGRLDATNAVPSEVTCITSIELEHVDKLGPDLASIAREKAGIAKRGVPLLCGPLPAPAGVAVREVAGAAGAAVRQLGEEIPWSTRRDGGECTVGLTFPDGDVEFAADGLRAALAVNHALAVCCARELLRLDLARTAAVAREARNVPLPGRLECVSESPWVIIDGAHTSASMGVLADAVRRCPAATLHLVVSVSGERDPCALLEPLLAHADSVVAVQADPQRSMPATELAHRLRRSAVLPRTTTRAARDAARAIRRARASLPRDGLLVLTGSMYLAGLARKVLVRGAGQTPQR